MAPAEPLVNDARELGRDPQGPEEEGATVDTTPAQLGGEVSEHESPEVELPLPESALSGLPVIPLHRLTETEREQLPNSVDNKSVDMVLVFESIQPATGEEILIAVSLERRRDIISDGEFEAFDLEEDFERAASVEYHISVRLRDLTQEVTERGDAEIFADSKSAREYVKQAKREGTSVVRHVLPDGRRAVFPGRILREDPEYSELRQERTQIGKSFPSGINVRKVTIRRSR